MREGMREEEEGKEKGGRDRERLWEVEVTGRKEELEKGKGGSGSGGLRGDVMS
jgi:hypothetical protein